jgi:5-methylcytosine-specific restriction endonuclease McrA
MSARKDLYDYVRVNGFRTYSSEELRVAGKVGDWGRVFRQLRQDRVIHYEYTNNSYEITQINEFTSSTARAGLSAKDRYRIQNRDGHTCQACGRNVKDNITLHVDHKIPLDCGGTHDDKNLWVLCMDCNQGKQAFFKDDLDSDVMALVFDETSGHMKLKTLFENSLDQKFTPSILQGISGIRDWPRTIRKIRQSDGLNIEWVEGTAEEPNGYYILRSI